MAQAKVLLSNHLLQQQAEGGVPSFPKAGHLLSTVHRAPCPAICRASERTSLWLTAGVHEHFRLCSLSCCSPASWRGPPLTDVFKPLCNGGPEGEGEGEGQGRERQEFASANSMLIFRFSQQA